MVDVSIITEGISDLSKIGGVSTWLKDLISGLPQISFSIINFTFEDNFSNEYYCKLPNLKSFKNILLKDYPLNDYEIEQILKNYEFEDAKIYHAASTGCASLCGMYLKKLKNKQFILTEHAIYWKEAQETNELECGIGVSRKITLGLKTIAREAYEEANFIITPTNFTRSIQIKEGANPFKCKVVNNGVDIEQFKFNYRFPIERIGFVGRISRIKNIERILNIWKILSCKINSLQFFIIGPIDDLTYYNELKVLINSLNLSSKVEFIDSLKREDWVNYIDLLFLASKMETQPYVILEALASGILTIAPNIGGLPETVKDAGLIYDAQVNDEEIASEMVSLISFEKYLKKKIYEGRELAEKTYNIKKMLNEYEKIYQKFL